MRRLIVAIVACAVVLTGYGLADITQHATPGLVNQLNTEGQLKDGVITSAEIKDGDIVNADINASAAIAVTKLGTGGLIPANSGASLTNLSAAAMASGNIALARMTNALASSFTAGLLKDDTILEADLKAVDTANDEDFLTYESTTGDFEWHSIADKAGGIAAAITEGQLADSIVVSADIKDATILGADIRTNTVGKANLAAADFGDFTVGADGTCELDSNSVGATELADDAVTKGSMNAEDFGDFTAGADGTCEIDSGAVTSTEIGNGTILGEDIRTNTVGKANLAAADFGDFTVGSDGTCTIDNTAVSDAKIASGVDSAKLLAGSACAAINLASATNINADAIASGTVPNARLDSDLQALAAQSTRLTATNSWIAVGNITNTVVVIEGLIKTWTQAGP